MSRIAPATPPYSARIQAEFDKRFPPAMEPIYLFRVLARDERLFARSLGSGLLDRGHLTLREREIVILRVCANYKSEYEWGVHVAAFGARAGLTDEHVQATVQEPSSAACWDPKERLIVRLCDELREGTTVTDELWTELRGAFSEEAILELLLLNGFYRTISILTNTLQMPLEGFAARFPE